MKSSTHKLIVQYKQKRQTKTINMRPPIHFLLGLIFVIILKLLTSLTIIEVSIILLASFLIDIDHWFIYILKKKDLSVNNAYAWFVEKEEKYMKLPLNKRKQFKKPLMIFHGIEFIILLLILSLASKIFIFIIIGVLFHLFCDYIDLIREKEPLYLKLSQIYTYIKNKGKKEFY